MTATTSSFVTPAVAAPVQAVLDLFETSLAEVRFGDIDAQSLARLAADVQAAAATVASAQSALEAARAALHERQEALLQQAQRALAHARVHAEADEALSARLEAIALPRSTRRARAEGGGIVSARAGSASPGDMLILSGDPGPAPRPRGRPRKEPPAPAPEPMLELEGLASTAE